MKYRTREILFREAVLAFLGAGGKEAETNQEKFCRACKKAKKDHCETCSKEFGTITDL